MSCYVELLLLIMSSSVYVSLIIFNFISCYCYTSYCYCPGECSYDVFTRNGSPAGSEASAGQDSITNSHKDGKDPSSSGSDVRATQFTKRLRCPFPEVFGTDSESSRRDMTEHHLVKPQNPFFQILFNCIL